MRYALIALAVLASYCLGITLATPTALREADANELTVIRAAGPQYCFDAAACAPGTTCIYRCNDTQAGNESCTQGGIRPYQFVNNTLGYTAARTTCVDDEPCTYAYLSGSHCY